MKINLNKEPIALKAEATYVIAAAVKTFLAPFNSSLSNTPVSFKIFKALFEALISTGKVTT